MPYFTNVRSKFYYWHLLVALIIVRYIFLTILDYSQYLYISQAEVPDNLRGYLTVAHWDRLRKSGYYAFRWEFMNNFIISSFDLIVVGFNLLPKSWDLLTAFTNAYLADFIKPEDAWIRSFLYYGLYRFIKLAIMVAPYLIYLGPNAKFLVAYLIGGASLRIVSALIFFSFIGWMSRGQKWLKAGGVMAVITALQLFVGSYLGSLNPPKHRFPAGPLKDKIVGLLAKAGFNTNNLFYIPGLLNAGTTGIGQSAYIQVGEKLLQLYSGHDDQVLAVIGHELGHWNYYHTLISGLFASFLIGIFIAIYTALASRPRFYEAFDLQTSDFIKSKAIPLGIGLILIEIIAEQLDIFLMPVVNYVGWMKEHACDAYSVKLGMGSSMYDALNKLCILHPLAIANFTYALFHSSHPPLAIRLGALRKLI